MARKKKSGKEKADKKENSVGGVLLTIFLTIFLLLFFLMAFVLMVKMDVGGFGSKVLAPAIRDVPGLNMILPEGSSDILASGNEEGNMDEAIPSIPPDANAQAQGNQTSNANTPSDNPDQTEAPATKDKLAEELEEQRYQERVVSLAESYSKMDPATAATDLEIMTGDLDLVCDILLSMSATDSANIISNMSAAFSAKVTKKMSMK